MCLICFLQEQYQYELRNTSKIRSDRFEHTLYKYKNSFIREFNESLTEICDDHNNENNIKIINILKEVDIKYIDRFFKTLIDVYISWINADLWTSIQEFEGLLKDYNILDQYENIDDLVLFRGRRSKSFISHWDMFHIPFNKRFHIGNQRYSLVGQPLLYLATSPYCVYRELESSEDLRISSFRFKDKCSMKIFNNSNLFYKYIKNDKDESAISLTDRMIVDNVNELEGKDIVQKFFLLILASVCSFQRREELKGTSFCEEYVLPQILAQIVKNNEFDGVMYTSTKSYYDKFVVGNELLTNLIYKNICLFTNYDKSNVKDVTYVYDKKLYEKFILSAPIAFDLDLDDKYYKVKRSLELVKKLFSENKMNTSDENIIYNINQVLISYVDISKNRYDNEEYTRASNLHCLLLRNIILNIIEEIKEDEIKNE